MAHEPSELPIAALDEALTTLAGDDEANRRVYEQGQEGLRNVIRQLRKARDHRSYIFEVDLTQQMSPPFSSADPRSRVWRPV